MTGYLRQDDDGHWFLVPANEIDAFREALELACADYAHIEDVAEFNNRFRKYRLCDSIHNLEITITGVKQ